MPWMSRTFRISLLLGIDVLFFFVELISGYAVGSLALVADSFHMLNDILSLIVALYAIKLTNQDRKDVDPRYTYGWHRAEILAALVNGVFLLALCFSIFMEAIERFFSTPEISEPKLIVIVGSLGLASNLVGLFLFHEHDHGHEADDKAGKHSHSHRHANGDLEAAVNDDSSSESESSSRGRSPVRERTDSMFGHPVATRAYVVQAAEDMHKRARSTSRRRNSSPSPMRGPSHTTEPTEATVVDSEASETSPLLGSRTKKRTLSSRRSQHERSHRAHAESKGKGHGHGHGSMNMQALVLHVLGDALGNVGVIATGLVIWLSSWSWKYYFDPCISLVITVIIFSSAMPLVKSASFILLQGVPSGISFEDIEDAIHAVEGVEDVHELHIWQLSELRVVASVHVHVKPGYDFMKVAAEVKSTLHEHGIHSSTVQPEAHNAKGRVSPNSKMCLLPCPPDQVCNPSEHACCPPTTGENDS